MCVYWCCTHIILCAHVGQFLRLENKYIDVAPHKNGRRDPRHRKVRRNVVQKTYYCTHCVSYNVCIYIVPNACRTAPGSTTARTRTNGVQDLIGTYKNIYIYIKLCAFTPSPLPPLSPLRARVCVCAMHSERA